MEKQYEGAHANAKGWFETIRDAYRDTEDLDPDGDGYRKARDDIDERMREGVLSVQVRSGWHNPGSDDASDVEYEILLTTGGPALRVWGELDGYGGAENAQLQMQDWGVPWREVWPCELNEMDEAREALLWFANLFYLGER